MFSPMVLASVVGYLALLLFTIARVLLDTRPSSKALGYLFLVLFIPVLGILLYFSLSINYRHRASKSRTNREIRFLNQQLSAWVPDRSLQLIEANRERIGHFLPLVEMLRRLSDERLLTCRTTLIINGEQKFPILFDTLQSARHHIHMEYYIWENDRRGNEVKELLLEKARQGVQVRVMYDAFGSRSIRHNIARALRAGGVQILPRLRITFPFLVNRLNHRDHRKIVIVDGRIALLGGINISDRYDNTIASSHYWRDTHLKVEGEIVYSLQREFIGTWNAISRERLLCDAHYFPPITPEEKSNHLSVGQVVAGGPTFPVSSIMHTYLRVFNLAKQRLYITNPYFIPSESIHDALKEAALSGVDVRIILPEKSDSHIVNASSKFYLPELLEAGVRIYYYRKGFIHAKTVVADAVLSLVGSANLDMRSFDLNYEIMAAIYDAQLGRQLEEQFLEDLNHCTEVRYSDVDRITLSEHLTYSFFRLFAFVM